MPYGACAMLTSAGYTRNHLSSIAFLPEDLANTNKLLLEQFYGRTEKAAPQWPVYKDKTCGTFYTSLYCMDFTVTKRICKKSTASSSNAIRWRESSNFPFRTTLILIYSLGAFNIYRSQKRKCIHEDAWKSKANIIDTKIFPYFRTRTLSLASAVPLPQGSECHNARQHRQCGRLKNTSFYRLLFLGRI